MRDIIETKNEEIKKPIISLLTVIMNSKGYRYIETTRPESNIRVVRYVNLFNNNKRIVDVRVDEREIQGLHNISDILYVYERFINKTLTK